MPYIRLYPSPRKAVFLLYSNTKFDLPFPLTQNSLPSPQNGVGVMTVTGHCATLKCHKQLQFTAQAPLPMLPAVPGVALLRLNEQNNFKSTPVP